MLLAHGSDRERVENYYRTLVGLDSVIDDPNDFDAFDRFFGRV